MIQIFVEMFCIETDFNYGLRLTLPVGKCAKPREECRRGAHLPFLGREPVGR